MRLLAVDSSFCFSSSAFSSFDGCVGSSFGGFASSFNSFASSFGCFVSSSGCVFSNRFSVSSHRVAGFGGGVSGFTASSEAQSRGGDGGSKNELTHKIKSLFSEWIGNVRLGARPKAGFRPPTSSPK